MIKGKGGHGAKSCGNNTYCCFLHYGSQLSNWGLPGHVSIDMLFRGSIVEVIHTDVVFSVFSRTRKISYLVWFWFYLHLQSSFSYLCPPLQRSGTLGTSGLKGFWAVPPALKHFSTPFETPKQCGHRWCCSGISSKHSVGGNYGTCTVPSLKINALAKPPTAPEPSIKSTRANGGSKCSVVCFSPTRTLSMTYGMGIQGNPFSLVAWVPNGIPMARETPQRLCGTQNHCPQEGTHT